MNGSKLFRLAGLIVIVAAADIAVLSPGLLNVEIGGSALSTATGVSLLLASALALFYGSYAIVFREPAALPVKQIRSYDDYAEALSPYKRVKALENDIATALEQIARLKKKKLALENVLEQRFDRGELSFKKFASVTEEAEKLFYLNVRSLLNRLHVFDEAEFSSMSGRKRSSFSSELIQEKAAMYNDHLAFVKSSLSANEELLMKLDRLLLEISRLDGIDPDDIDDMPGMQELDSLIKQTKFYKQ
ncbi:hypothetical protein ACLBWT_03160 [Paenibacillus sp. D51F]